MVALYLIDTRLLSFEVATAYLSPEESQKILSLTRPEVRNRQVFSQGLKRKILAEYLGVKPKNLIFKQNAYGKPSVLNAPIFFNLSHAGHWILLGISEKQELGVDVECLKTLNYLALAKRFFHSLEFEQIKDQYDFFKLWTYKEAFVKAIGMGLSFGLENFALDIKTGQFLDIDPKYKNFKLQSIDLEEGYFAALCLSQEEELILSCPPI